MKRILVAEDNESNFVLMTYILKGKYEVLRAVNGQDAVSMVERTSVDLILMDMKMPIMDGREATRAIKAAHPNLPIVALTANAFESDRQEAMDAGCDDFLSKPVNRTLCLDTIARLIGA
jgi:CheY-like chemotaxis protein